jgi:hypothetical protein
MLGAPVAPSCRFVRRPRSIVTSRPPLGPAKPSSPPFLKSDPVPQPAFVADGGGTKVVAPHESALCQAYRRAIDAGSY